MPQLTVYCLCAAWCRTCDAYAPVFRSLEQRWPQQVRWVWVDIEEQADAMGDVDVDNFPSLMMVDVQGVVFFGPVLPHTDVACRLIECLLQSHASALPSGALQQLAARLAHIHAS